MCTAAIIYFFVQSLYDIPGLETLISNSLVPSLPSFRVTLNKAGKTRDEAKEVIHVLHAR